MTSTPWKKCKTKSLPGLPTGVCVWVSVFVLVIHSYLTLCDPMNCSPSGSSVHGILQARIHGVSCHSLLQGIFPTQGLNLGPLHCRWIFYCLNHQGSPTYRRRREKYPGVTVSTKVYFYHLSLIIRGAGEKSLFLSLLGCIQFLWLYLQMGFLKEIYQHQFPFSLECSSSLWHQLICLSATYVPSDPSLLLGCLLHLDPNTHHCLLVFTLPFRCSSSISFLGCHGTGGDREW